MNVLFVCSKNQWRSPTAEAIYANHPLLNVTSRGTSSKARRQVSKSDLKWAEVIFVMEYKHKERLKADFRRELEFKEIHVLEIEDNYRFMDPELIEELRALVDPVLQLEPD